MLYDIDERAIHTVSQGKMPFMEAGAEDNYRAGSICLLYNLWVMVGHSTRGLGEQSLNISLTLFMRKFPANQ